MTTNRYTHIARAWIQTSKDMDARKFIEQLKQKHIICLADYTDIPGLDKPLINKLRGHARPYTTL